jgi:phosphoribosylamine---glycine ligase
MNILLLGSGGREHAFALKFTQSELCRNLYVAPGNAGTNLIAKNIPLDILDFKAVAAFCILNEVNLLVVGPEEPLVKGIRDFMERKQELQNLLIIGAGESGARLEGSKDFSKRFMFQNSIPTAAHYTFTAEELEQALLHIHNQKLPIVLKADGLAAGKGVVIAQSYKEAEQALKEILIELKFGKAGSKVVIEEFLEGIEVSVFVLTDGENYILLPEAKDYKRIGEQDKGLNTGGMGAVSPVPFADEIFMDKVKQQVILPTLKGLQDEKIPYVGFIFIGLMNVQGEPFVIEYNARMGDPETEVVLPRIETDLVELLTKTAQKRLNEVTLVVKKETAATIVLVSGGYPEAYENNKEITGLQQVVDATVFHAGTKNEEGKILSNGGRVLAITALGENLQAALYKANAAARVIEFDKKYYRTDIGEDLL